MELLFLHGLPGVGKLTVGRELEAITGYSLFHNHLTVDLATTVFDFGSPEFVDLREHIWLETFRRTAEAGLAGLIFTFAAERTVRDDFVSRAIETIEGAGGDVAFVELRCESGRLRERVEDPARREFGKLASAELLDTLVADGTIYELTVPPGARQVSVDNTHLDPPDAARRIAEALGE